MCHIIVGPTPTSKQVLIRIAICGPQCSIRFTTAVSPTYVTKFRILLKISVHYIDRNLVTAILKQRYELLLIDKSSKEYSTTEDKRHADCNHLTNDILVT